MSKEEFQKARDEWLNQFKWENTPKDQNTLEQCKQTAEWAYEWYKKHFKHLNDRFDKDQAIIDRLKEAIDKFLKEAYQGDIKENTLEQALDDAKEMEEE